LSLDQSAWMRTARWLKAGSKNVQSVDLTQSGLKWTLTHRAKHQIIKNFKHVLEEAGSGLDKIVKINIYITDMANFASMNEVYTQYFKKPNLPGRT
jgi:enamine deaminase RidA (YjgF/YER057c/UK114 family)